MTESAPLALSIALSATALLAVGILLGRRGIASGWADELPGRRRRVQLEDALKHVHDVEYRGLTATIESLAGALETRGNRAARIVAALEAEHLVERRGTALRLTEEGRSYARRILRIHRLWERWLAEETGVSETEWHSIAEKREHQMTDEEAEALAARMGHPAWDPHGDPIPTAEGELPPRRGVPLPSIGANGWGLVMHLEDEPPLLYAELVAAGLHPGQSVRLLDASPKRVRLLADGREVEISPVAAANVAIAPREGEEPVLQQIETLAELVPGDSAHVASILPGCLGAPRRRLLDLGLVPGTEVEAVMASAAGNPTAFRIRGSLIALRGDQSRWIRITRDAPSREVAS